MTLLKLCEKEIDNEGLDNLLKFWEEKIRKNLKGFFKLQEVLIKFEEIDKTIEKIESKKNKKLERKLTLEELKQKNLNSTNKTEENIDNLKSSIKSKIDGKSIFNEGPARGSIFLTPSTKNIGLYNDLSPKKILNFEKDEKESEKEETSNSKNKINNNKRIFTGINKVEDENIINNHFFRYNNKKSATLGSSLLKRNTLEIRLFNYQEEQKDNNFLLKTKYSKSILNYIDIDLFLQYIALGKNFFENEEDNISLLEGFCLQYQTFIFPEFLINKVISCFNYFYSRYINQDNEILEEKIENENESEDDDVELKFKEIYNNNNDNIINKKNNFKITNNFDITYKKIPYGIIDFLYTFIKLHNTYYHNVISTDTLAKISEFLKGLLEIYEIKNKYEEKILLSEIEIKEYEASIKKFSPIYHKISFEEDIEEKGQSSSDDFSSDEDVKEEKEEKEEQKYKKSETKKLAPVKDIINIDISKINNTKNNNSKSKLKTAKTLKEEKSLNLDLDNDNNKVKYLATDDNENKDDNKKNKNKKNNKEKEDKDKPFEFNILKYLTIDIASELTRVSYSLYSKIKIKEFLKGAFNGQDKYKSSPHICQIINRFNRLSSFVIEEILAYDHAEKRAEILLKFIRICVILKKIGNFDDFLSIMTGLTNFNINKLNKTWGHIPSSDMTNFREMKTIMSFEDNWKNLRNEIQKRIEKNLFYIPHLGYYTKRLLFLEELGPYIKKDTSLINIEKILEVYKVLKNFYQIKNVNYRFHEIDKKIQQELFILQCLEPANEDSLGETSNLLEPKFILSNKKQNEKRRTKTDINFLGNVNKFNII